MIIREVQKVHCHDFKSKAEIEKINDDMDGDIVNIEPGYYQLDKEEVFTEKHKWQKWLM